MSELSRFVNTNGMVSSKVIAEKFNKRHDNVLRDFQELRKSLPADFIALNFEENRITTLQGKKELSEVNMSRDGFSLLVMGFNGHAALKWKVRFLSAFNEMEQTIAAEIPALKSEIARLQSDRMALPPAKRQHGNKGLVWVPVAVETLFGPTIEYKKAPKTDPRFSDASRMEGEINRLSKLMGGMNRKVQELSDALALYRRR